MSVKMIAKSLVDEASIWRRSKDPPETLIAPGYSTHGPLPFDGKTIPPRVTPRW